MSIFHHTPIMDYCLTHIRLFPIIEYKYSVSFLLKTEHDYLEGIDFSIDAKLSKRFASSVSDPLLKN